MVELAVSVGGRPPKERGVRRCREGVVLSRIRRFNRCCMATVVAPLVLAAPVAAAELQRQTVAAFERYVRLTGARSMKVPLRFGEAEESRACHHSWLRLSTVKPWRGAVESRA
jgi:hypothetical protein